MFKTMPIVERRLRELNSDRNCRSSDVRPAQDFLDRRGLIVLGDPGSGKSTLLATLAGDLGVLLVQHAIERSSAALQRELLVLDALDEALVVGELNAAARLAGRLEEAGRPRFILSCREHDWRGKNDLSAFLNVYGKDGVRVCALEPLTRDEAIAIVAGERDDAELFVAETERRGLNAFLENPNDLVLLISAVKDKWPSSRRDLFERAVRILAAEGSELRREVSAPVPLQDVIDAAGDLCAAVLLSGSPGVSRGSPENSETVSVDVVTQHDPHTIAQVLGRRLFRRSESDVCRPAHRTVAEFLAGRRIAEHAVDPRRRRRWLEALAPNGRSPATALRGVFAWATSYLSTEYAEEWFRRDPIGVVLNGDATNFSVSGRERLLDALADAFELEPFPSIYSYGGKPWAVFASCETRVAVEGVLRDRNAPDALTRGLLFGLAVAEKIEAFQGVCLDIVRDNERLVDIRMDAAEAYVVHGGEPNALNDEFDACEEERSGDTEARLRSAILTCIPVDQISPQRVARLVVTVERGPRSPYVGRLLPIVERIATASLTNITDACIAELAIRDKHAAGGFDGQYEAASFMKQLLRRLAVELPEALVPDRLVRIHEFLRDGHRDWFDDNPFGALRVAANRTCKAHMAVFMNSVLDGPTKEMSSRYVYAFGFDSLLRHTAPFANALIDLASAQKSKSRAVAVFRIVAFDFRHGDPEFDALFSKAYDAMSASHWTAMVGARNLLTRCAIPGWMKEQRQRRAATSHRHDQSRDRFAREIAQNMAGIKSWRDFNALKWLGLIYFGHTDLNHTARGESVERLVALHEVLGEHTASQAIRALMDGEAVTEHPSAAQLGEWAVESQEYTAAGAALAALEFRFAGAGAEEIVRNLRSRTPSSRSTLAVLALSSADKIADPTGEEVIDGARWLDRLAIEWPDEIAQALEEFYAPQIEAGSRHLSGLHQVQHDDAFNLVASILIPNLAGRFPGAEPQVLSKLLAALLRLFPWNSIVGLVEGALSHAYLSDDARTRWVAVGYVVAPDVYEADIHARLASTGDPVADAKRLYIVLETIDQRDFSDDTVFALSTAQYEALAEWVADAAVASKLPFGAAHMGDHNNRIVEFVRTCLVRIANDASPAATDALLRLARQPSLDGLDMLVRHHQSRQWRARIDVEHRPLTPEEAVRLAEDATPVGPRDLKAVVTAALHDLSQRYISGDESGYRKFWNEKEKSRRAGAVASLRDVKSEDSCRDRLLEDLRASLKPIGVTFEPAVGRIDWGEADLIAYYGEFQVPIEVKFDDDRRIWTSPTDQLVGYAGDPRAGRQGVYVVFWTDKGRGRPVPLPPDGSDRPSSPEELVDAILRTWTDERRADFEVVVIDISKSKRDGRRIKKKKAASAGEAVTDNS